MQAAPDAGSGPDRKRAVCGQRAPDRVQGGSPGLLLDANWSVRNPRRSAQADCASGAANRLRRTLDSLQPDGQCPPTPSRLHKPHRAWRRRGRADHACNYSGPVHMPPDRSVDRAGRRCGQGRRMRTTWISRPSPHPTASLPSNSQKPATASAAWPAGARDEPLWGGDPAPGDDGGLGSVFKRIFNHREAQASQGDWLAGTSVSRSNGHNCEHSSVRRQGGCASPA